MVICNSTFQCQRVPKCRYDCIAAPFPSGSSSEPSAEVEVEVEPAKHAPSLKGMFEWDDKGTQ